MAIFDVRPLTPFLSKIAETELNEDTKRIPDDLNALKTWLEKQPHITARKDDQFLMAFLLGCKFSLERAKEKLDMYYAMKTACPEIFGERDPLDPKTHEILKLGINIPLPVPYTDGSRIILSRPCCNDPEKYNMIEIIRTSFFLADLFLQDDDYCTVGGVTNIIDLKGMTMAHSVQIPPSIVKKIATAIQEAFPYRLKGFHFINASPAFELIFKIFFQFLNDKLKKRVFMHSSLEKLHAEIPKRFLPKEYEGELDSLDEINKTTLNKLVAKRGWFLEDSKYKTDESKRIGKLKNADLLFGTEGSFRKLEID